MSASKDGVSPAPSAALAGLSGTILEQRYELGRVLGSGGMGAVFAARHLRLDRPVAIKVLRPMYAAEGEYVERFLREAKAASKIRHRNVVEIHDYGEARGGLVYSVMEYLVGQDLQQLLNSRPDQRIPWFEACGLLVQIASGLKAAHGKQVIHRDIKPANCFLTNEDGEPLIKLVDFGIARLDGAARGATLTGTAQVLGTPSYIAPEQVRTQSPASPQSDMYALGVVAYRMLTGTVPFSGATVFEILRHACFDPAPPMRERVPELPEPVERFVMELLAKEPEQRPADMVEVRERLVMLGRETLGAHAVVIPGSSALPLSLDHSAPPPGASEYTAVPRGGAVGIQEHPLAAATTEPSTAPQAGFTVLIPRTDDRRPSAQRAMGAPPQVLMAGTPGAPQGPVFDPASAPSRPGETVPAVGDSTLRSLEQSGAIHRRRRTAGLWVGLGGLAMLGAVGAFVALMSDSDESVRTTAPELATANVAPNSIDSKSPIGGVERIGVKPTASSETRKVEHAEDPSPVDVDMPSPSDGEFTTSSKDGDLTDDPESIVDLPSIEPPRPVDPAKPKSRSNAPAKSSGPPKDSVVLGRLRRTIAKRCAKDLGKGSVTVKFLVTPSGGVSSVFASGTAGACATLQVQRAKFQTRSSRTPVKFTVE